MKRMLTTATRTTAMATAIALSMLLGQVAMADSNHRDHGRAEHRHHDGRHDNHRDHDRDRYDRHDRDRHANSHRYDRRDYDGHRDYRAHRRYQIGRYYGPHKHRHYAWRRGDRLPVAYYAPRYVVRDYHHYRLRTPPRGYHWVRVDNDVFLAAITGGLIVQVVNDLFY